MAHQVFFALTPGCRVRGQKPSLCGSRLDVPWEGMPCKRQGLPWHKTSFSSQNITNVSVLSLEWGTSSAAHCSEHSTVSRSLSSSYIISNLYYWLETNVAFCPHAVHNPHLFAVGSVPCPHCLYAPRCHSQLLQWPKQEDSKMPPNILKHIYNDITHRQYTETLITFIFSWQQDIAGFFEDGFGI